MCKVQNSCMGNWNECTSQPRYYRLLYAKQRLFLWYPYSSSVFCKKWLLISAIHWKITIKILFYNKEMLNQWIKNTKIGQGSSNHGLYFMNDLFIDWHSFLIQNVWLYASWVGLRNLKKNFNVVEYFIFWLNFEMNFYGDWIVLFTSFNFERKQLIRTFSQLIEQD